MACCRSRAKLVSVAVTGVGCIDAVWATVSQKSLQRLILSITTSLEVSAAFMRRMEEASMLPRSSGASSSSMGGIGGFMCLESRSLDFIVAEHIRTAAWEELSVGRVDRMRRLALSNNLQLRDCMYRSRPDRKLEAEEMVIGAVRGRISPNRGKTVLVDRSSSPRGM